MIRAAQYNGVTWTDASGTATGSTAATGTITSGSVSSFSRFTFGSIDYVLPLTLLYFNAKRTNGYTLLSWKTSNEQAVHHFTIERSYNGSRFYSIGETPARNTGTTESYTSKDNGPVNGSAYYRLRSVDNDRAEKLSPIVRVTEAANSRITLAANPVHDRLTLLAAIPGAANFHYQIHAADGKAVQQGTVPLQNAGANVLPLKSRVRPGYYLLSLNDGRQAVTLKFQVR